MKIEKMSDEVLETSKKKKSLQYQYANDNPILHSGMNWLLARSLYELVQVQKNNMMQWAGKLLCQNQTMMLGHCGIGRDACR